MFGASSGGHFEQLMMLKPLMEKYESVILTEKTDYPVKTPVKTYHVGQINRREPLFPLKLVINGFKVFFIVLKEKPDVFITTGVLAMIPAALIMKFFKKKLIYIESFAKVNTTTMSGRFLYKYADRFYVQWEEMLKFYPDAIYLGGIY